MSDGEFSFKRVLLDTNVWRYLVDANAIEGLRTTARDAHVKIVASPAVLYESLRTGDPDVQRRLVKAITRTAWHRPMPEAFSECEAVLAELRAARPEWVRANPDLRSFLANRADWQGNRGIWRRARTDPAAAARVLGYVEGDFIDEARVDQGEARRIMLDQGDKHLDLRQMRCSAPPMPGYDGGETECWRFQSLVVYTSTLLGRPPREPGDATAQFDWINPFIDLDKVRSNRSSWNQFWLLEARTEQLPREWMRWACRHVQSFRKPSPGAPVDNQIGVYLLDCDEMITADRVFESVIDEVRSAAEFPFADVVLVPGGTSGATATIERVSKGADG